jgi:hypothetical protein
VKGGKAGDRRFSGKKYNEMQKTLEKISKIYITIG